MTLMDTDILIQTYPKLYHMADKDAWPSIEKHGLLSTTALLDLYEISGKARQALELAHRPESVVIRHPKHGEAVIRDQKPMDDKGLKRCLRDASPTEWYQILNGKSFFWLQEHRLQRLLQARAYREESHCILTVDTRMLIEKHRERINLSPINSGCTKPMPHPRGKDCFLSLQEYPFDYWVKKRGKNGDSAVELTVEYAVPDISRLVTRVEIRKAGKVEKVIFKKSG